MSLGTATTASAPPAALKAALAARLSGYALERGAVLINTPQVHASLVAPDIARNHGYFAYPPQALFYLGAVFDKLGVSNRLLDLNYRVLAAAVDGEEAGVAWRHAVDEAVAATAAPDGLVGITFMFDTTWTQMAEIVAHVKQHWPAVCVAVGGVAASADPERVLRETGADLVFLNEGETPLDAFYAALRGETGSDDLHNVAFLDDTGTLWSAPVRTGGTFDIDIRAQYDKVPLPDYRRIGSLNNFSRSRGTDVPFATMLSRRGCRARCSFCSVRNFNGKSVRVRGVDNVLDELAYLHDEHGIRHFDWLDDDLLYDRDQALAMFQAMARRLPGITWAANNGLIAAALTPELLGAMQDSGCIGFGVGMETGNKEMLRKVRKPASLETFYAFADLSRGFPSMHYLVNFILGLPGETFSQMLDSFTVSTTAALDWINFFTYLPLKNTDAFLAYGAMDDGRTDESIATRGTTNSFNPSRSVDLLAAGASSRLATGYDVFDLDLALIPDPAQLKEIWFTFNYVANFLRLPPLVEGNPVRMENSRKWLMALRTAYSDNPAIDCLLVALLRRLGAGAAEIDAMRESVRTKFEHSEYWRWRDGQFQFSALMDGDVPPLDARAVQFFGRKH